MVSLQHMVLTTVWIVLVTFLRVLRDAADSLRVKRVSLHTACAQKNNKKRADSKESSQELVQALKVQQAIADGEELKELTRAAPKSQSQSPERVVERQEPEPEPKRADSKEHRLCEGIISSTSCENAQ